MTDNINRKTNPRHEEWIGRGNPAESVSFIC